MKDGIIVQARMGSSRLPGKVLMKIGKYTILERIIHLCQKIKENGYVSEVVIATTKYSRDDVIKDVCIDHGIEVFRGSEDNVLERYYECAHLYDFQNVVRLTADNPFTDVDELQRLICFHNSNCNDYSESLTTLPIGIGAEIMSISALDESNKYASLPKHFEHVNEYILDNLDEFRCGTMSVSDEKFFPKMKFTVDTPEDYKKLSELVLYIGDENITTEKLVHNYRLMEGAEK